MQDFNICPAAVVDLLHDLMQDAESVSQSATSLMAFISLRGSLCNEDELVSSLFFTYSAVTEDFIYNNKKCSCFVRSAYINE